MVVLVTIPATWIRKITMNYLLKRRTMLAGIAGLAATPALAAKLTIMPATVTGDGVTLSIRDYSRRFLDFYEAAKSLTPDARYAVWQDRYGFAAVPPGPQGEAVARKLLDEAWPRYAAALPTIRAGAAGMMPAPLDTAIRIADVLRAPRPLKFDIIAYVGGFEENAFTVGTADGPLVCLPIEMAPDRRAMVMPHEMTHAVHMTLAKLPPSYERPLGRVVFEEGLAMRAVQALKPGLADFEYVGQRPWFDAALPQRKEILTAIASRLDASDGPTLFRFTMGQGATGREREAYLAGWLMTGELLRQGRTLPELARIPADRIVSLTRKTILSMLT